MGLRILFTISYTSIQSVHGENWKNDKMLALPLSLNVGRFSVIVVIISACTFIEHLRIISDNTLHLSGPK